MKNIDYNIKKQIIDEYVSGKSMSVIAKMLDINVNTVHGVLKTNNIPIKTKSGINKLPEEKNN